MCVGKGKMSGNIKICESPTGGWKVWRIMISKKYYSDIYHNELSESIEEAFKLI